MSRLPGFNLPAGYIAEGVRIMPIVMVNSPESLAVIAAFKAHTESEYLEMQANAVVIDEASPMTEEDWQRLHASALTRSALSAPGCRAGEPVPSRD